MKIFFPLSVSFPLYFIILQFEVHITRRDSPNSVCILIRRTSQGCERSSQGHSLTWGTTGYGG